MKLKIQQLLTEYKIKNICSDSRLVEEGDVFFALRGCNVDGNIFIDTALKSGASLVISDDPDSCNRPDVVYVDDARAALSCAASIFYPALPRHIAAVTGTNGKTSIVSYSRQLLALLSVRGASVGTLGIESTTGTVIPTMHTTPDTVILRQHLHNLALDSTDYVVCEASSHGLDQRRLYDIPVNVGIFTNLTQDHLDYHLDLSSYLQSKLMLFSHNLIADGTAIIGMQLMKLKGVRKLVGERNFNLLTVGTKGSVDITHTLSTINNQKISFTYLNKNYSVNTGIIGSFQGSNLLMSALLVHKFGFEFDDVMQHLSAIKPVLGRLERVTHKNNPYHIFVDYAHTPDALKMTLQELRSLLSDSGKLVVIFGCGGNRDRSKRSTMGKIAAKFADKVVVTDDNPRFEDPAAIRRDVLQGVLKAVEIADRRAAICDTIKHLSAGDILLIAGKGHETYQIIGDKKIHMDDAAIAREALL